MSHYDEMAGVDDARMRDPASAPAPAAQAASPAPDEADLAEMRRKLLVYGTAGNPVRIGTPSGS